MKDKFKTNYTGLSEAEFSRVAEKWSCFLTTRGSRVFGTNSETSDEDVCGLVCVPHLEYSQDMYSSTVSTSENDFTMMSLTKFLTSLEEGDPNTVEMIHIDPKWWKKAPAPEIKWIFDSPTDFITKNYLVRNSNFVFNQVYGKKKGATDPKEKNKLFSHALRCVNMGIQVINETVAAGEVVPIKLDRTGIDAEDIKRLKYQTEENQLSIQEMEDICREKLSIYESLIEKHGSLFPTVLPDDIREPLVSSIMSLKWSRMADITTAVEEFLGQYKLEEKQLNKPIVK